MTATTNIISPVQIIVGSMLGATEYVAESLQEVLQQHQVDSDIHFQPEFDTLEKAGTWVICSSTHGAGDLPDNIQPFAEKLKSAHLPDIHFITLALGDTSYDTFCQAGKTLFQLMCDAKANPVADLFCIDVLEHVVPEEPAAEWLTQLLDN